MPLRDRFILLGLAAVWGLNFSVIKIGLKGVPPLLLCALRFALVALPAMWLLPRPRVPWRHLLAYGTLMFGLHAAGTFTAIHFGLSAGLASLLLQTQVFVTMALAATLAGERPAAQQWGGALLAAAGLALLALDRGGDVTAAGLACILGAALCWGTANVLSRRLMGGVPVLSLVAWGSLVSVPLLLALSWVLEGPAAWLQSARQLNLESATALAYIVYPTTLGGFAVWSWQLGRHAASSVAPYGLLVPVFGLGFAALLLGEPLGPWKLLSSACVMAGVACTQWRGPAPRGQVLPVKA